MREEAKKSTSNAAKSVGVAAKAATEPVKAASSSDAKNSSTKKDDAQRRQQQSDASKPLRKELETIDRQMQSLTREQESLQTLLTTATAASEIAQTGKRLKAIENDLGTLEERWLELTEQIETATA